MNHFTFVTPDTNQFHRQFKEEIYDAGRVGSTLKKQVQNRRAIRTIQICDPIERLERGATDRLPAQRDFRFQQIQQANRSDSGALITLPNQFPRRGAVLKNRR